MVISTQDCQCQTCNHIYEVGDKNPTWHSNFFWWWWWKRQINCHARCSNSTATDGELTFNFYRSLSSLVKPHQKNVAVVVYFYLYHQVLYSWAENQTVGSCFSPDIWPAQVCHQGSISLLPQHQLPTVWHFALGTHLPFFQHFNEL